MPSSLPKAEFAFPGPLRDTLVAAILRGDKTSTTGLLMDYEDENEPLAEVGQLSAVVDSDDRPVAVVRVDELRVCRLGEVDVQHAIDEGESTDTLEKWREVHARFWHSYRPELPIDDDLMVVLERFHVTRRLFDAATVNAAFAAEALALSEALSEAMRSNIDANLPTRCPPWTVKEEFAHTAVAIARTLAMLDEPAPDRPVIAADEYYRADKRFAAEANAARVEHAQTVAAQRALPDLVDWFDAQWRAVAARVGAEPPERAVTTRWDDPMRLTDFQATRVVELAVHGIDLADALGVTPWLTGEASEIVEALFAPSGGHALRAKLGLDRPEMLRRLTGRSGEWFSPGWASS